MVFFNKPDMMTPEKLVRVIDKLCGITHRDGNVVEFELEGMDLVLIYDEAADRMRIISPVCKRPDCDGDTLEKAMEANFHSALDARYAVSNGVVWSAFIHPLSSLSEELLQSAIQQVAIARATFGDEFTSGFLKFGG